MKVDNHPQQNQHDQQYLDNLRHSAAHLLAAAVMDLWPDTKRTIGPAIKDGFYFDFEFQQPISESDFKKIEKKMRQILKSWDSFERHQLTPDKAKSEYPNNPYKHELIDQFAQEGQKLSFYKSGEYWDLCRGGHVDTPKQELKHFKLLSIAGAYWRGDEKNSMLTRIYGTAFPSAEELKQHLQNLEEAKKRDHKKLGVELDLFSFSDKVGPGLPLWTPKGTLLRNLLDDFVQELRFQKGYTKVEIPHITKKDLYQTSGHWDKFADELFRITTREGHEFAMKPMNCPHHTQIFDRRPHSYKEMPQRYANTTMCYRDEQTGELSGLSRVRSFTQDDAHVFCRESQVEQEAYAIWDIIEAFYKGTGFPNLKIRLSLHDPNQFDKYLGTKEIWEKAENQLREMIQSRGVDYFEAIGEAAFYGPKIDFMSYDSLGREWQVATIQIDRNMPDRFDLNCINEDSQKERIVMIHAAIMGSIERFLAVLIEHFGGAFPLWISPEQVAIVPISDDQLEHAQKLDKSLRYKGIRSSVHSEGGSMQKRIRNAEKQKIPYMLIIGKQEVEDNSVSVRARGQKDLGVMSPQTLIDNLLKEINTKAIK